MEGVTTGTVTVSSRRSLPAVNGAHGAGNIQVNVREQLQRENRADSALAVNGRHLESEQVAEELCHNTGVAEQDDPAVCSEKRRTHQAQYDQDMPECFPCDVVPCLQVGHRHTDQPAQQRRDQADLQAVSQRLVIVLLLEETLEIVQGNPVSLRGIKTVHDQRIERIYKEKQEYENYLKLKKKYEG